MPVDLTPEADERESSVYLGQHVLLSLADLESIHRRQQALKSLMSRRHRRLQESLEDRILRARRDGTDPGLSQEEWARLHEEELVHARKQIDDLELEMLCVREQATDLKRTMARAKRLRERQSPKSRSRT